MNHIQGGNDTSAASKIIFVLALSAWAGNAVAQGNLIVTVRHAPSLNGPGRIEGSAQQLLGENVTLNGGFVVTGDLFVPGTPTLQLNGNPTFAGTLVGPGNTSPTGHKVTLNGNVALGFLRTRTDPIALPTVPPPPAPGGTRSVTITSAGQSIGDPATLRNLTLNGNIGQVAVPAGTYGNFIANGGSGFIFGVAGATTPTIYNLQNLTFNGSAKLVVLGPILLTVANGFTANGILGTTNQSSWLQLQLSSGGLTLNGGSFVHAHVTAPAGTAIVNGNSCLIGTLKSDRLTINGNGCIKPGAGPVNQPPLAHAQTVTATEDTAAGITLTGADPEGAALTYVVLANPTRGTLNGTAPHLVYTPALNEIGPDSFTFKVNDGAQDSATATVSITITPVNDAPVAQGQNISTAEDTLAPITLLGSDVEGGALAYSVVTQPQHGILLNAAPDLLYEPDPNYSGPDSFSFRASDGQSDSETATVSITVNALNDRPVADGQALSTDEDMELPVLLTGTDIENALLTFTVLTPPAHGTLTGTAPNLTYLPANNYFGADSFAFQVSDGSTASMPATISLTIRPVNDRPIACPTNYVTLEDTATNVVITASDVEDANLAYTVVTPPAHGSVAGTGTNLVYSPDTDYHGPDAFAFKASDGSLDSETVTVSLMISPVNDRPIADAQSVVTDEDTAASLTLTATDVDGDALVFSIASLPSHGTVTGSGPNLTYTPDDDYHGADSFTYIANDGAMNSRPATVTIVLNPVNDAPVADPQSLFADEDTPVNVTLSGSDADGDAITFVITTPPQHGVLSGTPPNITYASANAFFGSDSFAFVVSDGQADSAQATLTITVAPGEIGDFSVEAGADQVVTSPSVTLAGSVNIPGPVTGAVANALWSKQSGPGPVQFTSPAALATGATFSEAGTYVLKLRVSYGGGQRSDTLTVVVLPSVPERLTAARSSSGSDFWLTFLDNGHPFGEPGHSGLSFAVTAEADTTGVVSFFGQGEWRTNYFAVSAGTPTVVPILDFGNDPTLAYSDTIQDNAIHIATAAEVTVYALNYLDFTTDGYLALPTALLGTEYVVLGYKNSPSLDNPSEPAGGTQFAVVATEDGTLVTITPTLATDSRAAGVPFQITLQRGQTYRLMNVDSLTGDLSGTTISADKPIAVFGGHQCANVPEGVSACDHLVEQLPPVNLWGQQFVTMPLATRTGGDTFRILAATEDTMVAVNGEVVARLGRGQFHERTNVGPSQIISSQPVLVAQYANGSAFDGSTGDPFMMLVPPTEQFGGSYTLATPQVFDYWAFMYADIFNNYLNLIVGTNGVGAIQLDGAPVSAALFQPIGDSGYAGAQLPVPAGTHRLTASVPFGVSLYGWAQFESYACIGGIYSESVEADTQLALRQSSDRSLVGTEKLMIASVTNGRQRPLSGIEVNFTVTGANGVARRVRTNPSGEAVFAYNGTNAGDDLIQASVVGLQRSLTNTWLQSSDNLPPVIDPGGNQLVALNEITHLAATVSDDGKPVGGLLSYQWRTVSGFAPARFAQPNQPATGVSFDLPGVYLLELAVSDSMFSTRANVTITVNDVPRVHALWSFPSEQPYSVGQVITLLAQVSDSDGDVALVEFFDGELKIGEASPPEYPGLVSIDWVFSQPGDHSITVLATDDRGGATRSAPLAIRVVSPPTVEWLSPANGHEAMAGVPLPLSINATDADGTVTNVTFVVDYYTPEYARAEFVATGTGPTYTGTWTPPRAGDYYFSAHAWDNDGAAGVAAINLGVTAPLPTVTLQAHLPNLEHGALVGYPLLLIAEATVVEPVRIQRVEFYQGSEWIGSVTNGPYLITYAPTNPGPYSFTARAFTEVGSSGDSDPVAVTAVPFLKVLWEDPQETEWVPLGSTRLLSIRLHDLGGIFSNVTFLANSQPLATTDSTFMDWVPGVPGDYVVQARVTDVFGNSYLNEELTLRVAELRAPQVQILQPANGARFAAGIAVNFLAEATDSDNAVTNLSLHLYSTAETTAPGGSLSYSWQGLPAGEHEFTATATDATGQRGEARVRIIVEPPLNAGLPAPQNLRADAIGCNAIRISWDYPSTDTNEVIVVERATGASDIWEPVGYLPADESSMENHRLTPMTLYRYRAYVRAASGERSPDSSPATAATRPYVTGLAVLDLAEALVDDGVATPISARLKQWPREGFIRAWHQPQSSAGVPPAGSGGIPATRTTARAWRGRPVNPQPGWLRHMPSVHGRNARTKLKNTSHKLLRVDNSSPLDLGLTEAFGLSDNNEVLLLDPFDTANPKTFLWRPNAEALEFDRGTFQPYRLADFGPILGANLVQVQNSQGQTIPQWHAGLWGGSFLDFTPDVAALRIPIGHPPHPEPYPVLNALLDMSRTGFAVGLATWLYFPDENPNSLPLTAIKHATLWPSNDEPPVSFGALQQLNNESGFWAINEEGEIVGQSRLFDAARPNVTVTHAVRSHISLAGSQSNDKLEDMGTLGGDFSAALAINQEGTAVGYSTLQPDAPIQDTRAAYWLRGDVSPRQLPGYGATNHSYAWDIDDRRAIIGQAVRTGGGTVAALWQPNTAESDGYTLRDLNDYTSNSKWFLTSAQYINTNGLIVGRGLHARTSFINGERIESAFTPRTYLLLPDVSLAVDYNRDGKIELNEKDNLPANQPYQFWVNNDTDNGDVSRDKLIHAQPGNGPNYEDNKVNGNQDLTDWFPVHLNISNLLAILPPGVNEYYLVNSDSALNFLYTDLWPDLAGRYLATRLQSGFGEEPVQPAESAVGVQQVTATGVLINRLFLARTRYEGKGILLFEARQPTTKPLRLEVRNNRRVLASLELPLKIGNVEDMYGWYNMRFVIGDPGDLPTNFRPSNAPRFADQAASFVFLHGYNVNEMQSRDWSIEMFKRMWWSGSVRKFFAVSWPGDTTQVGPLTINYHLNVQQAIATAPAFAFFVNSPMMGGDVTVAAHSLANMVVSPAIQDHGARPTRYLMVDCAVAMEAYDANLPKEPAMIHPQWRSYTNRLYASEWHTLFPDSDGRHGLTWRGRFKDVHKLTQVYNFYSSGEEVLENISLAHEKPMIPDVLGWQGGISILPGTLPWALQEVLKGRVTTSDFYALYGGLALVPVVGFTVDAFLLHAGVRGGNVVGSKYAGWGFNPYWDVAGTTSTINANGVTWQLYQSKERRSPEAAVSITPEELQTNSFFLPFLDADMYQPLGHWLASDPDTRTRLLAEAIPALTFATGANPFPKESVLFPHVVQFDMNKAFQRNGWPGERTQNSRKEKRWFHSDVRDIPHVYNGTVFEKWVELGGGR